MGGGGDPWADELARLLGDAAADAAAAERSQARVLRQVAVVPDLERARLLVEQHPGLRAVTAEGDLLGTDWAVGGSASAPSLLEVQAAVDEAAAKHDDAQRRQERLRVSVGVGADAGAVTGTLLDRQGKPINVPVRIDRAEPAALVAELALAPLAVGDYVLALGGSGGPGRLLVPLRVVP